jgi:hypothetical protein
MAEYRPMNLANILHMPIFDQQPEAAAGADRDIPGNGSGRRQRIGPDKDT